MNGIVWGYADGWKEEPVTIPKFSEPQRQAGKEPKPIREQAKPSRPRVRLKRKPSAGNLNGGGSSACCSVSCRRRVYDL